MTLSQILMPIGSVLCGTAGYFVKTRPQLRPLLLIGIVIALSGIVLFIIGY